MTSPAENRGGLLARLRLWLPTIALVTFAGFASKLYPGPGAWWFNDHLAGLFYVVFWCLIAAWLVPRASTMRIVLVVASLTCALEALQLWHPSWLTAIRRTFVGASLLGTTFQPTDFLYYWLGAPAAWFVLQRIRRTASE